MKRHIPNILSASRIVLSPLLLIPFVIGHLAIYFPLYFLVFSTDILDGKIARRLHIESEVGTKLDSAGDMLFFICAFASVLISPIIVETRVLVFLAIGFACHFLISIVTYIKFKVFVLTMHTYFAKLLMLALSVIIPVTIAMGRVSFPVVVVYVLLTALHAVDGIALITTSKTYNGSHRGFFHGKIVAKHGEDCLLNRALYKFFY